MRRSSAPSAGGLNKRGKFSTPFVAKPSEAKTVKQVSCENFTTGNFPASGHFPKQGCSNSATPEPELNRRPLTEILSLLGPPCSSSQSDSTATQPQCTGGGLSAGSAAQVTQLTPKLSSFRSTGKPSNVTIQAALNENSAVPETEKAPDGVRYFEVIWCKKSTRKHKKWEGDALMEVHRRHVTLTDLDGKEIGQCSGYKIKELEELTDGSLLSVGGKEVEIQNSVTREQFVAKTSGAAAAPAPPAVEPPPPPPPPPSRPFISPLAGAAPRRPGGGPVQPRFDPRSPGALVMPRPSAQYQWRYNGGGDGGGSRPLVDVVVDPHLSRHLRPHQRDGVSFLYRCVMGFDTELGRGAVLADQMGLGKTLQCIALIWTLLKQGPFGGEPVVRRVLIVTPSSLVRNWVNEFKKWLGKERLAVFAVDQNHTVREFAGGRICPVLIVSYEMAVRSLAELQRCQFDLMICDEGHRLKNSNIKTATALTSLECPRRVLMTGTPVQNDLLEFFSLLQFVNPGALGSLAEFRRDYERPVVEGRQPGASEEIRQLGEERAEQLANITDRFILRRTQEVLDRYLPPKVETVVFCRPSPLQEELYDRVLQSRELQQLLSCDSSSAAGTVHLVYIALLRKLCSHPALLRSAAEKQESALLSRLQLDLDRLESDLDGPESGLYRLGPGRSGLQAHLSGKMAVVSSLLESLQSREKVVLISYYTQTLDLLAELCQQLQLGFFRLDGSTPSTKRQSLVDQFNSSYSTEAVFLLSAKAGGVGLNLVGASSIVLFDLDWNPANDLQALARVWRDGQKRTTRVYRLLTAGTIEEKIYQRQISKQGLSAAVVDAGQRSAAHFSRDELRDLFSLDDGVDCSTHDLLSCGCDLAGGPCPSTAEDEGESADTAVDVRPCQLGPSDPTSATAGGRHTGMERLLEWQHYGAPFDPDVIQDEGLARAGDVITFLFRHVVAAAFE
ncbi:DNA repair and recombination protein RAD54B-like [Amphibalanus amphitrite]|uniref:DNA repair and recombination protein RAD54B-like n=1 Tax=Amphibalanus amphitrite TaxID=1232801 RepID=UPI001C92A173|nr:DNA repair and recombination protein RAD54B-like [Amphibalanus amphitrite]XP_043200091.1 DNA repair and recombination protein RAD54B-like [Amphibalanus amphitrite]XP_043200099.1 DNA repair and recombination protein RAD54B-like [Amphibalanus amphitrite]